MMNFNSYIPLPEQNHISTRENHISTWVDLVNAMFVAMAYINSREAYILATENGSGLRTN